MKSRRKLAEHFDRAMDELQHRECKKQLAKKDQRIAALEAALQSEVDNYHAEGDGGYVFDDDTAECCACGAVHTKRSDNEDCHRTGCFQRIHERSEDVLAGGHSALDAALEKARKDAWDDESPGTPGGIIRALWEFAEQECGHNPASARHAMSTVIEKYRGLAAHCERLKEELRRQHPRTSCADQRDPELCSICELLAATPTDSLAALKRQIRRETLESVVEASIAVLMGANTSAWRNWLRDLAQQETDDAS